jgi:hypothetical protein
MAAFYFATLCESGKAKSNKLNTRKQTKNETVKQTRNNNNKESVCTMMM